MNKHILLDWLLNEAEQHELELVKTNRFWKKGYQETGSDADPIDQIQPEDLKLPGNPDQHIPALRQKYKDKVALISRLLFESWPDCFLFYRPLQLENEILDGLAYFVDIVPEFQDLPGRVGEQRMDAYLKLNQCLFAFARRVWLKNHAGRLMYFIYKGLGSLFLDREDMQRQWIVTCGKENYGELDRSGQTTWSARKEMRAGDLIFVYRTAPDKAITDLYRAEADPSFSPYTGWEGFMIKMKHVCRIEKIPFSLLRVDPVFGEWSVIRRQLQGVIAEPIPNRFYNRLLEFILEEDLVQNQLRPETIAATASSGDFPSEADFDEKYMVPLLKKLGLKHAYQYVCNFQVGSQVTRGRVDFLVSDERGRLTLIEDKLRIRPGTDDLEMAAAQARLYALQLALPSFVVAAPEGLWIYRLANYQHTLEQYFTPQELESRFDEVRTILERLKT